MWCIVKSNVAKISDYQASNDEHENDNSVVSANSSASNSRVLLATALISVKGKNNEKYALRALIDQGSQSAFITESAMQLLKLKRIKQKTCFAGPIDILLGAAEYAQIIKPGLIKGSTDEPIAQNSELGWIISGPTNFDSAVGAQVTTLISVVDVEQRISEFFKHDDIKIDDDECALTEEEQMCENHFQENTIRLENGRYCVKMPFKNGKNAPDLGNSRKCAIATFLQLENRFKKNPKLAEEYKKFIHEYIDLGHMERSVYNPNITSYYLPHHCVIRDSTTTKLRVVFNGSQKTDNGKSLNDELALGAIEQKDMLSILINFRIYKYAFTADIEKMYRQILIDESQRDLQKIIWRDSPELPLSEFRLITVTYGTSLAPFLSHRTTRQLAIDCENEYPEVSNTIRKNMWVDDVVKGAFTEAEAIQLCSDLRKVFSKAGFNLRKWSSNNVNVLSAIPESDRELKAISSNVKALGIKWSPSQDVFTYELSLKNHSNPFTKRLLLSEISSMFDPLGWICPVVISAKILVQKLWEKNVDWDEIVPKEIAEKWLEIKSELHLINDIRVERWINYNPEDVMELHGFGDAAEPAFAAVIYIKNVTQNTSSIGFEEIRSDTKSLSHTVFVQ
ncbi:uncharacterized protein LOC129571509 [Sitodiplosis mosellana]|uniref:uncharacterized protein LOC129571509 n=1 Tax=Sitodiplosis mosellana TaxID=263140 RepID=UPI0024448EF7|nr:uncharacterized protein LOC129571509 [Sitodiplosis mosellana]